MTPEKLKELEKLEAAATPGEWEWETNVNDETWIDEEHSFAGDSPEADAKLTCALRNNAHDLFAALREAWRERDEARAALRMLWEEFGRSSLVSAETRAAVKAVLGDDR